MNDKKGNLLLLSILATTAILAGVFTVSTILVREVRLSKNIDDSLLALLGAEGALEEGLFGIRKEGKSPGAISNSGTLNNGVNWAVQASATKLEVIFDSLARNITEKINLFNRDNPNDAAGVESVSIDWNFGSNLELSIREWDGVTLSAPVTQTFACGGTPCTTVTVNSLSSTRAYELAIKAVGGDILDLKIKAWTGDGGLGSSVAIPVPITIEGSGSFGTSRQALTASIAQALPWQP